MVPPLDVVPEQGGIHSEEAGAELKVLAFRGREEAIVPLAGGGLQSAADAGRGFWKGGRGAAGEDLLWDVGSRRVGEREYGFIVTDIDVDMPAS